MNDTPLVTQLLIYVMSFEVNKLKKSVLADLLHRWLRQAEYLLANIDINS